ncbi:acetylglutamate kinase [Alicyclobacillus sp. SO9]|uniref:acetylglutamate kinase n=1 Tax=Alicyclobacillus sp. SO9 TaxID=2665646 RepID=UPI0018E8141B|nr:acetylglutamate kinase [Alicyclobacillus sp. SO9]QQE80669.1 acetylglutamate kinase [Alicyclobacillus sp. SO9]
MQTVVVKIGGSLAGGHLNVLAEAMTALLEDGAGIVLVHGGGPRISDALRQQRLEMPWFDGQRVTSVDAVHVVQDVLCRQVNAELTRSLADGGIPAHGVCGADGVITGMLFPKLKRTADVKEVNVHKLTAMLQHREVPVVAPVGRAEDGGFCNINADLAAASIAKALQAERLIFLTDVDGIYYDWDKQKKLEDVHAQELLRWLEKGAFASGMIPKVRAVLRALGGSVESAYVVNGSNAKTVMGAALTSEQGTWSFAGGTRILNARRRK